MGSDSGVASSATGFAALGASGIWSLSPRVSWIGGAADGGVLPGRAWFRPMI